MKTKGAKSFYYVEQVFYIKEYTFHNYKGD